MQLAMFSDYALRVLMHLAASPDRLLSTRQLSEIHDAKFNHLAKVTAWLVNEGLAVSNRGRGGGLRLAKEPGEINVGAVLWKLEKDKPLVECMGENGGTCCLTPACGLTTALQDAEKAFFDSLRALTVADVIEIRPGMSRLLASLNDSV